MIDLKDQEIFALSAELKEAREENARLRDCFEEIKVLAVENNTEERALDFLEDTMKIVNEALESTVTKED